MKKLLVILFLTFSLQSVAQHFTDINQRYRWIGGNFRSHLALPADTFNVPVSLQSYPWMALKNDTLWTYSTSSHTWSARSIEASRFGLEDITATANREFNLAGFQFRFKQATDDFFTINQSGSALAFSTTSSSGDDFSSTTYNKTGQEWNAGNSNTGDNSQVIHSSTGLSLTDRVLINEVATPSTPASGKALIYPKADGNWYGLNDAGLETKISNDNIGSSLHSGRVSGGDVLWISGYNYNVSPAIYYIDGVQYTSGSTDLSLSAADATHNRFDLFVLNTSGDAEVIEGTPAASPLTPNYDPATQLPLYYVLVVAGSTQPATITQSYIYRENTEWTTATSGGTINANSSTTAYAGTKSVEGSTVLSGHYVTFTTSTTLLSYDNLSFAIKSKAAWGSRKVSIQFYNGSTPVGNPVSFTDGRLGFVSSNTSDWQIIIIPIANFSAAGAAVTQFKITASQGGSGTLGFHIDDIQLQGISQNPPITQGESTTAIPPLFKIGFAIGVDTTIVSTRDNVINLLDSLGLLGGGGGGTPTLDAVLDNNSTLAGDVEIDGDGTNFWALIEFAGYSWNTEPEPTDGTWSNFAMDQYSFDLSFTDGSISSRIVGNYAGANDPSLKLWANNATDRHEIEIQTDFIKVEATGVPTHLLLIGIPVYADEAAAVIGGIPTGTVYRTTTGELRIKL
jgi:hypothetical protein